MLSRPSPRPSAGALVALLALAGHAQGSVRGQAEQGSSTFEASASAGIDQSLKSDPLAPLLADERAVEISWLANEGLGLREYRLTAVIERGALAGTVARWRIEPGTGEPVAGGRIRAYRVKLPLLIEPGLQIHASLEAVRLNGERRLLAQQNANPRGRGHMTPPTGPRLKSGLEDEAGGFTRPDDCGPGPLAAEVRVAPSAGRGAAAETATRGRACQVLRERGPPGDAEPASIACGRQRGVAESLS